MEEEQVNRVLFLRAEILKMEEEADFISKKLMSRFISETRKSIKEKFGLDSNYSSDTATVSKEAVHTISIYRAKGEVLKEIEEFSDQKKTEFKTISCKNNKLIIRYW